MGRKGNYTSCNSHRFTCSRAPTSTFRSLPQLSETLQKINWHKCLREPYITSAGSHPDWALWSNSCFLKSVPSLTEVDRLMDRSRPGGQVQEKKSLTYRGGVEEGIRSVCTLLISIVSKLAAEVRRQLNLKA